MERTDMRRGGLLVPRAQRAFRRASQEGSLYRAQNAPLALASVEARPCDRHTGNRGRWAHFTRSFPAHIRDYECSWGEADQAAPAIALSSGSGMAEKNTLSGS